MCDDIWALGIEIDVEKITIKQAQMNGVNIQGLSQL